MADRGPGVGRRDARSPLQQLLAAVVLVDEDLEEAEVVRAVAAGLERGGELGLGLGLNSEQLASLLTAVVHRLDQGGVVPVEWEV